MDPAWARATIAAIAADAEAAFDPDTLWRAHPRDLDEGPLQSVISLYLGAGGVIWALDELARAGLVGRVATGARSRRGCRSATSPRPDFPEDGGGPVPSLWMGEAGILLVAHRLAPARWHEERCSSASAPTRPTRRAS